MDKLYETGRVINTEFCPRDGHHPAFHGLPEHLQHDHRGLNFYPRNSWLQLYNFLRPHVIPGPYCNEV